VYLARLDPVEGSEQAGFRPVVIVSRDVINDHAPVVIVVPLTSDRGRRPAPGHVPLGQGEGGLQNDSVALCEHVRSLSKTRLLRRWGSLGEKSLARLDDALKLTLDLP
jgi:mRNA interferase MazF